MKRIGDSYTQTIRLLSFYFRYYMRQPPRYIKRLYLITPNCGKNFCNYEMRRADSAGEGRQLCGGFGDGAGDNWADSAIRQRQSGGGDNAAWRMDNNAKNPSPIPIPRRPFLRRQESHSVVYATIAKSVPDSHSPRRPFLRRQESHSVVYATIAKSAPDSHSPRRPFLRRQESHSVVPPTIAKSVPDSHSPPQTIPAKAGISQCRVCNNAKNPSPIPVPPVDHSCEGRNLTVSCRQQSPNSPPIPIHRRPFLRRQESHSIVSPNVAGKGVAL